VQVSWKLTNRTKTIRLAEEVDLGALREQLDHARSLRFTPSEIIYLRGQTFYGQSGIFKEGYVNTLQSFQLPDYELGTEDGQIVLRFAGSWWETTMWEIPALAIVNELRSEEHTSELQSRENLVCRLLLEKKKSISWAMKPLARSKV